MNELVTNLFEKLKSFIEMVVTLFLDFLLIVVIWWLKAKTFELTGLEEQKSKDPLFKWVAQLSDIGTFLFLVRYILLDIIVESTKTYKQLKQLKQDLKAPIKAQ